MTSNIFSRLDQRPSRLSTSLKQFRRDEEGVAAIEFAIIAPVMITMYFGLAEMATAISADRRISHGTNVAGDLVTQNAEMSVLDIEESLSAAVRVMAVPDAAKVTVDMRSYTMDSDGIIRDEGIVQLNPSANTMAAFDASVLDSQILNANSGVVVTRVAYTYTPLKLRFFDSDVQFSETFMLKPRRSKFVTLAAGNGETLTCSATSYKNVSCSPPPAS